MERLSWNRFLCLHSYLCLISSMEEICMLDPIKMWNPLPKVLRDISCEVILLIREELSAGHLMNQLVEAFTNRLVWFHITSISDL